MIRGMAQDKIGVAKMGERDGVEYFSVVFIDAEKFAAGGGYFQSTSEEMTEDDIRAWFAKGGQPAHEVEAMFEGARRNWKP